MAATTVNGQQGRGVGGPPPRPLPGYEFTVKDGEIYVGKPLGAVYGA